jgi:putative SOS response-associated peptidase YedK
MCGRVYETFTDEELSFRYLQRRAPVPFEILPKYNLCPTQVSPALRLVDQGRQFDLMHWQLVPDWEPTFKTKLSTINAKSETVFRSSLYRDLVFRQRCIVPLSGFFEWKRDGQQTRPFKIHLSDEPIMSVAGIWSAWQPGSPNERLSFSILTTSANEFMSKIHHRMPVILSRSDEDAWVDPTVHDEKLLRSILKPCPSAWLTAVEVSTLVNSAANDRPEVLEPANGSGIARTPLLFDC